jgi:hypothetical protein
VYYNNIISQSDNKSKRSWRILRNEMGVIKNKKLQTTYKIENQCIRSNNAANAFNNYFINIVDTLPISKLDIDHAVQLTQNSFPQGFPDMPNIPVTESEIICTIKSLKSKDSSGYDGITNRILKVCGQYLGKPLAYIYNISLKQGKFPARLKYSVVVPVFKSGDKMQIVNYRPISLLTGFSKIFENLTYSRIMQHICHNILVSNLYGFKNGLSTDNAIFKLTESVFKAWN